MFNIDIGNFLHNLIKKYYYLSNLLIFIFNLKRYMHTKLSIYILDYYVSEQIKSKHLLYII